MGKSISETQFHHPVSIIVSCLNEEATIGECLERLTRVAPQAEIIVVHGGKDRTHELASEYSQTHRNVIAIRNENDIGKGSAVKVGIARASLPLMCQIDADLQFNPEDLSAVMAPLMDGKADVVIGSRFMKESDVSGYKFSFFRVWGNRIVNAWVSLLCGCPISDVTTGYKAWTREAIQKIDLQDDKFVYEVEIPVRAVVEGFRVAQVPICYNNRQGGVSGHGAGWKEVYSIIMTGILLLVNAPLLRFRGKKRGAT